MIHLARQTFSGPVHFVFANMMIKCYTDLFVQVKSK